MPNIKIPGRKYEIIRTILAAIYCDFVYMYYDKYACLFFLQLNILQGLAQFNAFLHKLEKREKVHGNQDSIMYK